MTDLSAETVKQALAQLENWYGSHDDWTNEMTTVVQAAGRWEEGTPIQWCEVHLSVADSNAVVCHWDGLAGPRPGRGSCRIVERRLCQ